MKTWGCLCTLIIFLAVSCKTPPAEQSKNRKVTSPNILFLFTDDHAYEAIGALGNDILQTPNLDRLVNAGTTFTHAYNMGGWNGAVCVASRAMIISGATIWRARKKENLWRKKDSIAISETWGRLMAKHGYNTYMSGKWHVQAPAEEVFDRALHVRPGMPPDNWGKGGGGAKVLEAIKNNGDVDAAMPAGYNRPKGENDTSWSPTARGFGGYWEGGTHWSEVLKDDAVNFIEEATTGEEPFFMYLAFNAPHDPRQAPRSYLDQYPLTNIPVPKSFIPEYPWKDSIGNSRLLRDEALAPFPRTEYAVKKHIQEYYALISHLDAQIGEIINALERSGEMDETYIFFTSDHGLSLGQHGLMGKQSLRDHSIRVPLMVIGPDIPKGKKCDQDVYLQDVMATTLELAGIPKPSYVEFNSFLDIINGERKESHYDAIYGCYMDYQRMIRKDDYKLLVYPRIDKVLLFNLDNDPEEVNNLADDPAYSEIVRKMFSGLVDMQKRMDDDLSLETIQQSYN
jgi:arylsulfatase A-like enzyme